LYGLINIASRDVLARDRGAAYAAIRARGHAELRGLPRQVA
jgi:hypothetical protein